MHDMTHWRDDILITYTVELTAGILAVDLKGVETLFMLREPYRVKDTGLDLRKSH